MKKHRVILDIEVRDNGSFSSEVKQFSLSPDALPIGDEDIGEYTDAEDIDVGDVTSIAFSLLHYVVEVFISLDSLYKPFEYKAATYVLAAMSQSINEFLERDGIVECSCEPSDREGSFFDYVYGVSRNRLN